MGLIVGFVLVEIDGSSDSLSNNDFWGVISCIFWVAFVNLLLTVMISIEPVRPVFVLLNTKSKRFFRETAPVSKPAIALKQNNEKVKISLTLPTKSIVIGAY